MTQPNVAGVLAIERALEEGPVAFRALVASLDAAQRVNLLAALLAQLERREEGARAILEAQARQQRDTIARLEGAQELVREALEPSLGQLLKGTGRRSLAIPGVGRVGLRKAPKGWNIIDQAAVLASLSADEKAQLVERKDVLDVRKLKAYLDVCEAEGTIVPGVERSEERDNVTLTKEATGEG